MQFSNIPEHLKQHGIRPSVQRIRIYEKLIAGSDHPTIDQIYHSLIAEIPTLSKTTVYNTLSLFQEQGIACAVKIDDQQIRYDWNTQQHGHFQCIICNEISDLEINQDSFNLKSLENHIVKESHFYLKGICSSCITK